MTVINVVSVSIIAAPVFDQQRVPTDGRFREAKTLLQSSVHEAAAQLAAFHPQWRRATLRQVCSDSKWPPKPASNQDSFITSEIYQQAFLAFESW